MPHTKRRRRLFYRAVRRRLSTGGIVDPVRYRMQPGGLLGPEILEPDDYFYDDFFDDEDEPEYMQRGGRRGRRRRRRRGRRVPRWLRRALVRPGMIDKADLGRNIRVARRRAMWLGRRGWATPNIAYGDDYIVSRAWRKRRSRRRKRGRPHRRAQGGVLTPFMADGDVLSGNALPTNLTRGSFARGGVIPGRPGSPRLLMAHAGERVLPRKLSDIFDRFTRALERAKAGIRLSRTTNPPAVVGPRIPPGYARDGRGAETAESSESFLRELVEALREEIRALRKDNRVIAQESAEAGVRIAFAAMRSPHGQDIQDENLYKALRTVSASMSNLGRR